MPDTPSPIIMWFRQDLRLADNPALLHAANSGKPVICLYVHDEISPDIRPMGAAQEWWLHHSLVSHRKQLGKIGGDLILRSGAAGDVISEVVDTTSADAIVWNRRYGEGEQAVDSAVKKSFAKRGYEAKSFAALLMHEPKLLRTGGGDPYKVYTPFWKKFEQDVFPRKPVPAPEQLNTFDGNIGSDSLEDWGFLPTTPDWATGIAESWTPGEAAARKAADDFLRDDLADYDTIRDQPGPDRTSRLSPHLRFGEISPYQLFHDAWDGRRNAPKSARLTWVKELVWREFSYHLLQEWPDLHKSNFKPKFDEFPWQEDKQALRAWQRGQTGYPIVDAGMRQLWQTGWMHNRVRMIVASFLIKHLLIDWRDGEAWFWDTLVDGDPASNPAQWQWVAGSGADASPFFRIFNPIMQSEKFDQHGAYIKRYVPELKDLPNDHLPAPWDAPEHVLIKAGVVLGETYPKPIVDHKWARERALEALDATKG
ncbi:MAG: deoxyribodipyrimidine photo-lyase [Ahrensia sp.]|nr:deoxyribodipyrimidine photo-lyase [Ahrensia sp.]